eukprot:1431544-Rhodomonas_salina.2
MLRWHQATPKATRRIREEVVQVCVCVDVDVGVAVAVGGATHVFANARSMGRPATLRTRRAVRHRELLSSTSLRPEQTFSCVKDGSIRQGEEKGCKA